MGARDPLWAVSTAPQYKGGRWDPDEFLATGRDQVQNILDYSASIGMEPKIGGSAMDFGCGVGRLSQALTGHFERVTGVDIAPSMLDQARWMNEFGEKITFVLNHAEDLAIFDDATFDFVYSEIVLQHMEPRYSLAYIKEFLRVVKPGGIVAFQIPEPTTRQNMRDKLPRTLVYTINKFRTLRRPMMEMYGINLGSVRKLVDQSGGELVNVQNFFAADRHDHRYWIRKSE